MSDGGGGGGSVVFEHEIREIIAKDVGDKFRVLNHSVKPASENPMGFLGNHYRLTAKVAVDDRIENLSYFLKEIPTEVPQHTEYALKTRAFYKEIELYKTLFADMEKTQKDSGIFTKWCPKYYYSRGSELFVLEDLSNRGYYMYPERELMDEEHVKASLNAMAAMHAASIVFEEKSQAASRAPGRRSTVGEVYAHLTFETEASDEKGHPGNTYHEAGIKSQLEIVEFLPGYSDEEKKLIKEKLPDVMRHFLQLVKPSDRFKNVFVHGDLWANNLLFRKDAKTQAKDALIIDFQLARYAPPAHDVMMFLHLVQSKAFRERRLHHLLHYYHASFEDQLRKSCLEPEALFPKDAFFDSCRHYDDLGLISKLFYFQLILAPPRIAAKFLSSPDLFTQNMLVDRTEMVLQSFLEDEVCKARVVEALDEVIEKFILPRRRLGMTNDEPSTTPRERFQS